MHNPTYHHSRKRRGWRRVLVVLAVLLALLTAAAIYVRHIYYRDLQPASDSQKVMLVTIRPGTSSTEIGAMLQRDGLIRSAVVFQWYIRNKEVRDQLQAGTYALRASMNVPDIVQVLVKGKIASNLVTIVPGQRIDEVRQTLINAGFQPDAVDAALQPSAYTDQRALLDKPAGANLEGFLYPDSFQKNADTAPSVIITESLNEMADHLTPDIRASFARHGLSVFQGVILASIVEREVSHPADRAQVAQVFLKRLASDMPLGSDPTALYGAILADQKPSLTYDSPYNTLIHKGLPPGPISNVSDSSLRAVAYPAATDWLYFVSGDDGTTHFSHTLDEHEALTKQYCHKLCTDTP